MSAARISPSTLRTLSVSVAMRWYGSRGNLGDHRWVSRGLHEQGVERRELIAEVIEAPHRVLGGAVAARDAVSSHGGVVDDLGGVFRGGGRLARRSPRGVVRKRRQEDNLDEDEDDEAE